MLSIEANSANEAFAKLWTAFHHSPEILVAPSRNGVTHEFPYPICIQYNHPERMVLDGYDSRRANPFLHLFESQWILNGRRDVAFLEFFNPRMRDYSDDGKVFNAAYGHRLRSHFIEYRDQGFGEEYRVLDQIKMAIEELRRDPTNRQVVLQIWDPKDLVADTKDKACNQQILFRARPDKQGGHTLDMTVTNRSNDFLWGALGANIVQFSVIHCHVAHETGLKLGKYFHISNCMHMYIDGPGGALYERMFKKFGPFINYPSDTDLYEKDSFPKSSGSLLQEYNMSQSAMGGLDVDLFNRMHTFVANIGNREATLAQWVSQIRSMPTDTYIGHHLLKPMLELFIIYKTQGRMDEVKFYYQCKEQLDTMYKSGFGSWANAAAQFCIK